MRTHQADILPGQTGDETYLINSELPFFISTGRDNVRRTYTALFLLLVLCALCVVAAVPAAADEDDPFEPTMMPGPVIIDTPEPTELPTFVTPKPTTIETFKPVTAPPTVTVPTVVTPMPTLTVPTVVTPKPTQYPTITIEPTVIGGGKGYIDTYCNVDGAAVAFDGAYKCTIAQGVCTVGVSPTGTPIRTITVSKAGYTTWSGPLSRMPYDGEHIAVYSTINPVTTRTTVPPIQNGQIYAESSPTGAAIYLNGNFQGYAPLTIPNLPPSTYSLKASLSGYSPNTQMITVYSGQTATYYPVLQQSPPSPHSTGTVTVTSSPDHALVYVDGTYQGKSPLTVTLYPGSHTFRLSLDGYNDYTTTVYVSGNSNQNLNAVLSPAIFGTVSITSLPGASVFMDSNAQGTIPNQGVMTISSVTSGNHLFKVTAPGYNDWMNTIYIVPNAITPINAALTPVGTNPTPVPATGGFNIVSTPSGAEVYVDNLFKGYTPAVLTGIPAGQHTVLLKYTGYIDYTTTASVTAGQTTPLAISMQPAPAPTPESAPSAAALIAGIMAAFVIGSILRREKP